MSEPVETPAVIEHSADELMAMGTEYFNRAMKTRTEMNIRVAKRVTSLIRGVNTGCQFLPD
jgi:hypothetical protein